MEEKKICIIDDDEIYRLTTQLTIRKMEKGQAMEIIEFHDGEAGYEYILKNKSKNKQLPDLILLDINMPIMDGWEFINMYSKIKGHLSKDIKIFLVSSSVDPADKAQAENLPNVKGYITKPLTSKKIEEILHDYAV